jgi:glutamyl-Q tRNA(Asp) synthetase
MSGPVDEISGEPIAVLPPVDSAQSVRFAPTPSGYMHLGHAYSALIAWSNARAVGSRFLLRIEDIDRSRCRPAFEQAIYEDLAWLGIDWQLPVRRQAEHMADYADALKALGERGVLYPCFCTRSEVQAEIEGADAAPHGPDGPHYPGTCRRLSRAEQNRRIRAGEAHALRLDMAKAAAIAGPLTWIDRKAGEVEADPLSAGDVVLARKDVPTSYHLAVTLDDHIQGVSLVTRGWDLYHATHIHRLLQALLGLDTPVYYHHPMITDPNGVRLAKRNRAVTLRALRNGRKTLRDVRRMINLEPTDDERATP